MLYLVTGASGSGKTTCLEKLRELCADIIWHDFDELGVPADADKWWRQRTAEHWVKTAIQNQNNGRDTGVSGGVILGEVLACPSASQLDGVAACLLDCYDVVRIDRLRRRGLHGATQEMLCWAAWQRMHAVDPQWRQDVIREGGAPEMRWDRWESWLSGDARWQVQLIDTTAMTVEQVALEISKWVDKYRSRKPNDRNSPL